MKTSNTAQKIIIEKHRNSPNRRLGVRSPHMSNYEKKNDKFEINF